MTMRELKAVADGPLVAPLYLFYGEESFLSSFYSRRLCDRANEQFGMADFNFCELEGDKVSLDALADMLEAMPMFAQGKCILLKDFDFAALNKEDASFFLSCLETMPDTTVLVMSYPNLNFDGKDKKWVPLLEAVGKRGTVAECSSPSTSELSLWVCRSAERNGAMLTNDNARYLLERVGTDMRRLRMEIGKLSALADGEILQHHIDAVAVKQLEAKVYDMVRALSARKFNEVYRLLDALFESGEEPELILGAVAGNFADIYRAKLGRGAGKSEREIAADFGLKGREFRIRNAMRDAGRYTERYLYRCIEIITLADNELKNSRGEPKMVFEKLIARIAAAGVLNG